MAALLIVVQGRHGRGSGAMIRGAAFALTIILASGSAHAQQFVCSFISDVSPKGPQVMIGTYTLDSNMLIQSSPAVKFTVVQNTAEGIVAIYPDPEMRFSLVMMINRKTGSYTLSTAPGALIVQDHRIDGKCQLP